MGFLIDTSLWVAVERGLLAVADIHAITRQEPIYLSPVIIAEIRYGIELMEDAAKRQRAMKPRRSLPFSPQNCKGWGEVPTSAFRTSGWPRMPCNATSLC